MELVLFLKGILVGFSIAAPIGPIGILCIRRTFAKGRNYGFYSGLGAATADSLYGCIAAFGLTFISDFIISQKWWLSIVGGIFLCWMGLRAFLSKPLQGNSSIPVPSNGLLGSYLSTFVLTLTNPLTIIAYIMIFAGLGLAETGNSYFSAAVVVLGVFIGSSLWWLILSVGISIFQIRLSPKWLLFINKLSGVILLAFGIFVFWSFAR